MEIKIQSSEELSKLLDSLALEIVDANIYHQLYLDLINMRKEYFREFSQSNTFWSLTLDALYDARMIRLCRIFDRHTRSLNLVNLLDTFKANIQYFHKEHFRERLKDNAFVNSLVEDVRIPDEEQLDKDIWFSSPKNPIIKKLMCWRGNVIAHKGANVALGKNDILVRNPISEEEIAILLDESHAIHSRYSILYQASIYSLIPIGHDDYKSLFKFLRIGLEKWKKDRGIDNEI